MRDTQSWLASTDVSWAWSMSTGKYLVIRAEVRLLLQPPTVLKGLNQILHISWEGVLWPPPEYNGECF